MTAASGRAESALRLVGSQGATTLMHAELKRLVMRSPFRVRLPDPVREGDTSLIYPFSPEVAWVAACYHRTSSRILWDVASSPATRLEPLFEDLRRVLAEESRFDGGPEVALSVEVKAAADIEASPLQVRGTVKNAIVEGLATRSIVARLDADAPAFEFMVRRSRTLGDAVTRTVLALDIGGGARHVRGTRAAMVTAPMRETLAAQLVLMARWDPRSEPLVDPMTGGGTIAIEAAHLARAHAVRRPEELSAFRMSALAGMPSTAPDLFGDTTPRILACDTDAAAISALVGNLRASGLAGTENERMLRLLRADARDLTPERVAKALPDADITSGVFAVNPPYGVRLTGESEEELLDLHAALGDALRRFSGWRAVIFVANSGFVDAFGGRPRVVKPASNAALRGYFLVYDL